MKRLEDFASLIGGIPDKIINPELEKIRAITSKDYEFKTGITFVEFFGDVPEFESIRKIIYNPNNYGWGELQEIRNEMILEFERLRDVLFQFEKSKINKASSPMEVNYVLRGLIIRCSRILSVLKPRYHLATSGGKYIMAVGFWSNEFGVEVPSITKNIGLKNQIEHQMESLFEKVLLARGYNSILRQNLPFDYLIEKNDRKWVVDLKFATKKNRNYGDLIMTFMSLELWRKYNSLYKIL
ncbi:MAG TPA: hypothetical protein VK175_16845 [Leadbetterella sp.]|nr:hypothetical protein [Leadbetterella sp.]